MRDIIWSVTMDESKIKLKVTALFDWTNPSEIVAIVDSLTVTLEVGFLKRILIFSSDQPCFLKGGDVTDPKPGLCLQRRPQV